MGRLAARRLADRAALAVAAVKFGGEPVLARAKGPGPVIGEAPIVLGKQRGVALLRLNMRQREGLDIEGAGGRRLARAAAGVLLHLVMLILGADNQLIVRRQGEVALQRYALGILLIVGVGLVADRQRLDNRAGDRLGGLNPIFKFTLDGLAVGVEVNFFR